MKRSRAEYIRLSKVVSHALRHEPWLYELEMDEEGWVPLDQLLEALRALRPRWSDLERADLEALIRSASKRRFEICNDRIRALYGHSLPGKLKRCVSQPPPVLFHGTSPASVPCIQAEGLKPMRRQYVHLSVDEETALEVGKRKAKQPALLCVRAGEAFQEGIPFYQGNEKVWLADAVPPRFIDF